MVLALAHFAQHNSDLKRDEIVLTIFFNECSYCLQEALHPKVDVVHLYFTKIMPRCTPAFPPKQAVSYSKTMIKLFVNYQVTLLVPTVGSI